MAELKNSKLLENVLTRTKALTPMNGNAVTAEKFLIALLEISDVEEDCAAELSRAQNVMEKTCMDWQFIKDWMLRYVQGDGADPMMSGLYMQKQLYHARSVAAKQQCELLTVPVLLQCILAEPSDAMKKCFADLAQKRQPKAEQTSVQNMQAELEKRFDESFEQVARAECEAPEESDARLKIAELTQRVKDIHAQLSDRIFGQDNAISVFTTGYFQAELLSMTDKKRVRPRATYLFAGPPGVGKTFLAESAAKVLKLPFKRFDMSEYCDNESAVEFCGSDKVYKNGKPGNFTSFVSQYPKSVVLFDEIEKAHLSIIHLFLQILDAGRIRDNYTDADIPLKDVIMIFTTNAGKRLYEDSDTGDFSAVSRKVILRALQKDINPQTGEPYFPGAICSRFASGNVVMFNHIAAHNLRDIARREVLRHADNFEKEIGVRVQIDEKVYTSLLFSEGGAADARTVRSRAESFFDNELFELFRLTGSDAVTTGIADIETIRIGVELPGENEQIMSLFESREKPQVLVFSSDEVFSACDAAKPACQLVHAGSTAEGETLLRTKDIQVVLLDLHHGLKNNDQYLNIEDIDSAARDFFWHVRQMYGQLPIYLLQTPAYTFDREEKLSFMRQGVRGILMLSGGEDTFGDALGEICDNLHQQQSMVNLARANKLVTFETAQDLTENGKTARITLFDFELVVAMDPEDSGSVLSNVSKPNVSFDQVIGAEDAKKELQYFVSYLKDPKKYLGTGVRAPRGVLLYGPPGTGKTMLAKAMASQSDVTFITAEGNQFLKQYVGEGSEKVHELFRTARKYAPSILFVDEIDAIAKERGNGEQSRGSDDTLTAFLTEMDGFKNDTSKPVFVLAATNYDVEPGHRRSLDPALMRRFDRRVYIDLPNRDDRIRYMKMKARGNPAFEISEEKLKNLAVRSTGMSLAELESVFEMSLRTAIREGQHKVSDAVLEEAFETFNSGEKKTWDEATLERVARHEAGHAFLCWQAGETPSYVTVVARADHGGYMQHGDHEGKAIYTKEELLARIRTSLGGRAAEIVYYGPENGISTGAGGDLTNATGLAQRIVCAYGMDDTLGLAVIQPAQAGELSTRVHTAVNGILSEQMAKAVELIRENRDTVDRLVEALLSRNHLTGDQLRKIFEKGR